MWTLSRALGSYRSILLLREVWGENLITHNILAVERKSSTNFASVYATSAVPGMIATTMVYSFSAVYPVILSPR